jgi:ribosomal 50S subunit-recycling heat shock protein
VPGLRTDVVLHRLCLARSRSEAKQACDAGAVQREGRPLKASHDVSPGDRITIAYPRRTLEVEILELPGRSVSRKAARELYRVLRDERTVSAPEETW